MNSKPYQNREDGRLKLAIKEEQITVAPEGKARVHVAVINEQPEEDYVDILVKGVPSDWTTIDTPVVHVAPGEIKEVDLTVQPPAVPQSRVGHYPLDVRAVSQNDPRHAATARSLLTVAAYQSKGRIGVMLGSIYFAVTPGSSVTIPILLQNRGLEEDNFRLNVNGIPANWISTNAALTSLEPSASKEIQLTVRVPRSSAAPAGRMPFTIRITSQSSPDQSSEVECILTISTFSQFSVSLQPENLRAIQPGNLIINNEGNTRATYNVSFQDATNQLLFEKAVSVARPGAQPGTQQVETAYVGIPQGDTVQIPAGERGVYPFRSGLRSRPFVGGEQAYPFSIEVLSTEKASQEVSGTVSESGLIPPWLVAVAIIGVFMLCALFLFPLRGIQNSAHATQTAAFNQTQAALAGQADSDGDGLIDSQEVALGTDPFKADTDGDGLSDAEEVNTYKTNPLVPDTDEDGLTDGEEVQAYKTDPLKPDTDGDLLNDGDEIKNRTDPLVADTDQDGLGDGAEISLGTNPLQQDTDRDGLLDGQENQTCPRPLSPDSDNDGIIDGNDLDPCNPQNPSLTATAAATQPTPIVATPTSLPTNIPTAIPTNTPIPTNPPVLTPTAVLPNIPGVVVFESNRDGNSEIYGLDLATQAMVRLTNNAAVDTQPALAPDSQRVAYVSNQNGNNEIYLTGLDRRAPVNLTNNPADDQQPTWSPDGNWIAFTSNRDGNQEIYVMRSDGTEVHNLTNNAANDFAPAWFSVPRLLGTEDWIAFTSTRDGNLEIYKVKPDGTGLENLTKNPANDYSPSGSGGQALLAFVSDRSGNPEVFTMTDTGGAPTNITNNPAQDLDPSLNSNGNWVTFTSDRDGNLEIYLVGTGGGASYNLTRNPAQDRLPNW